MYNLYVLFHYIILFHAKESKSKKRFKKKSLCDRDYTMVRMSVSTVLKIKKGGPSVLQINYLISTTNK